MRSCHRCRSVASGLVVLALSASAAAAQSSLAYDVNYAETERRANVGVRVRLPTSWNTNVGTDFSVPRGDALPEGALAGTRPGGEPAPPSVVTWGKVDLPSASGDGLKGPTFEARINPAEQRARLATTLTGQWAVGSHLSASINDTYVVVHSAEDLGAPPVWETRKGVRLTIRPSRTTFLARTWRTSNDPLWHTTLGAEQTIFEGLNVGTSITDPASADPDMRIRAGYRMSW